MNINIFCVIQKYQIRVFENFYVHTILNQFILSDFNKNQYELHRMIE